MCEVYCQQRNTCPIFKELTDAERDSLIAAVRSQKISMEDLKRVVIPQCVAELTLCTRRTLCIRLCQIEASQRRFSAQGVRMVSHSDPTVAFPGVDVYTRQVVKH